MPDGLSSDRLWTVAIMTSDRIAPARFTYKRDIDAMLMFDGILEVWKFHAGVEGTLELIRPDGTIARFHDQ